MRLALGAVALLVAVAGASPLVGRLTRDRFDHEVHKDLFPSCLSCHAGITAAAAPTDAGVWPAASTCAACHDGTVEDRVDWAPPPPPRTNLRFTHPDHARELAGERPDSTARCQACHAEAGAEAAVIPA